MAKKCLKIFLNADLAQELTVRVGERVHIACRSTLLPRFSSFYSAKMSDTTVYKLFKNEIFTSRLQSRAKVLDKEFTSENKISDLVTNFLKETKTAITKDACVSEWCREQQEDKDIQYAGDFYISLIMMSKMTKEIEPDKWIEVMMESEEWRAMNVSTRERLSGYLHSLDKSTKSVDDFLLKIDGLEGINEEMSRCLHQFIRIYAEHHVNY